MVTGPANSLASVSSLGAGWRRRRRRRRRRGRRRRRRRGRRPRRSWRGAGWSALCQQQARL
jgi:hypothetical protein